MKVGFRIDETRLRLTGKAERGPLTYQLRTAGSGTSDPRKLVQARREYVGREAPDG
jgi:hypothetical protein